MLRKFDKTELTFSRKIQLNFMVVLHGRQWQTMCMTTDHLTMQLYHLYCFPTVTYGMCVQSMEVLKPELYVPRLMLNSMVIHIWYAKIRIRSRKQLVQLTFSIFYAQYSACMIHPKSEFLPSGTLQKKIIVPIFVLLILMKEPSGTVQTIPISSFWTLSSNVRNKFGANTNQK